YRKSGMEDRLVSYMRAYQSEGDRLRPSTGEMVRSVLSYLHTRPILLTIEHVRIPNPDKKNKSIVAYSTREHERRFYVVPDLLAAVTAIQRARLQRAKDDAARAAIAKEAESARAAIADEAVANLAEEYENGAVMDFFFADRLRDFQASGFDIGNFFAEIIADFDPAKETNRLETVAIARARAATARKAHPQYLVWLVNPAAEAL